MRLTEQTMISNVRAARAGPLMTADGVSSALTGAECCQGGATAGPAGKAVISSSTSDER